MGVSGGNLNVKNIPMGENGREWSNGLYDCTIGTCKSFVAINYKLQSASYVPRYTDTFRNLGLCACCCPCVIYAKNKRRYDHMSTKGTPDPDSGGGCCSCDCIMYSLVGWCGVNWLLQVRQTLWKCRAWFWMTMLVHATRQCSQKVQHQRRSMQRLPHFFLLYVLRVSSGISRTGVGGEELHWFCTICIEFSFLAPRTSYRIPTTATAEKWKWQLIWRNAAPDSSLVDWNIGEPWSSSVEEVLDYYFKCPSSH